MIDEKNTDFEHALDLVEWTVGGVRWRGKRRAENVLSYCRKNHLSLDDVVIEEHTDYYWPDRRNRLDNERRAECIGYTNSKWRGYPLGIYWVMPRKS